MNGRSEMLGTALAAVCLAVTVGCTAAGPRPVVDETTAVETVSSRYAEVASVRLYREDRSLVIRGHLRKRSGGRTAIRGHLDIEVVRPDGMNQMTHDVPYRRVGVRARIAHFSHRLTPAPPAGSRVRVVHHSTPAHTAGEPL